MPNAVRIRLQQPEKLPTSLPPLGINREQAAELVGVSPSTFDKLVSVGRMPRPRIISAGRIVFDVSEVAEAFRQLPHQPGPDGNVAVDEFGYTSNPWDE